MQQQQEMITKVPNNKKVKKIARITEKRIKIKQNYVMQNNAITNIYNPGKMLLTMHRSRCRHHRTRLINWRCQRKRWAWAWVWVWVRWTGLVGDVRVRAWIWVWWGKVGVGEDHRRRRWGRVARVTRAFVGILEGVAEKPKSHNKAEKHQHRDNEDEEDLCSFTHITHFVFLFYHRFELGKLWIWDGYWGWVAFGKW